MFLRRVNQGRNKVAQLPVECGELTNAIRADAVDAKRIESFPLGGIVRCPRDDSRTDLVGLPDEIVVDVLGLLPEILRTGRDERRDGVDVARNFEHSGADGGEDAFHGSYNAVVERVYGAARVRFAYAADHERLDAGGFDLNVNYGSVANGFERFDQRRNLDSISEREFFQLASGDAGDWLSRIHGLRAAANHRIMMHDYRPVIRGVNVELDPVRAQVQCTEKGWNRILRKSGMSSPMGDAFRAVAFGPWRQRDLAVIVFAVMSAKL